MKKLRKRLAELRAKRKRQRKRRNRYAKKHRTMAARAKRTSGRVKRLRARIMRENAPTGDRILAAAAKHLGKWETSGPNDAPWLRRMEARLVKAGLPLSWMIPGNPYCGMGVIDCVYRALGVKLPADWVYTPNILRDVGKVFVGRGGQRYRLVRVAATAAKPGAFVLMDFGASPDPVEHVGIARGPLRAGVMPTRDYNTSPTNAGSQANGGGVYDRDRYAHQIVAVLELRPVN